MNEQHTSAEELKAIRKMMEESSRFLSLSGLSGIFAGSFAILGALVAHFLILDREKVRYDEFFRSLFHKDTETHRWQLCIVAIVVLLLSLGVSFYLSRRKAQQQGQAIWNAMSKRFLTNLMIPLVAGGSFLLILLVQNHVSLIIPGLLIFYGLALVNAGKFSYGEIFYLGILEIVTGLVAALFPDQGLWFWVFGFGILHIVYGLFMYRKYEA